MPALQPPSRGSDPLAPAPLDIAGSLAGERLFITGATGFLGKVLVERLLWAVPEVERLLLLVRPGRDRSAAERVAEDVLAAPIMARLRAFHGASWTAWAAEKIEVVAGDLGEERFGLSPERYAALCGGIDRIVASAATVTFDERLDRALASNVRGALRTLALARDAGGVPLAHVSTCFVSGRRRGLVPEAVHELHGEAGATADPEALLAQLDEACRRLRADPAGALDGDRPWVHAGAEAAARHGFNDVYTLTKALAERLLVQGRGAVPLAIVRPAIVESAAAEPIPGWLEAVRVTDPLLVAYGRGRTRELPGVADAALELVPVDYVVHALLAAMADLPRGRGAGAAGDAGEARDAEPADAGEAAGAGPAVRVYQVGSSRNPITLGELLAHAREGFARTPLQDEPGQRIRLPPARFARPERFRRKLLARRKRVRRLGRWLPDRAAAGLRRRLAMGERTLEHFVRLLAVYRPYLEHGARYDDAATRGLWERLSAAERESFPFDVAALDWPSYIAGTHIPGLVRFALKAETGAPSPPRGDDPLAALHARDLAGEAGGPAGAAATVYDLFRTVARADPDPVAFQTFRDGRWLSYTYGQALTATANVAGSLAARHGIGRGDRVVLWASGSPEWVLAMLALHRLGAVAVPLDPQWPAAEAAAAARFVAAKLILAAPRLVPAIDQATGVDTRFPVVPLAAPFIPEPDVGRLPGAGSKDAWGDPRRADDLAIIVFTSGTTVSPKAVPLTHANLLANVRDLVPVMRLSRERLLSVLPIHHVFELMVGLLVPLAGGSTISYVAEIKPAEISWMMTTTRPTVLVAVPRLLELLHNGIRQSVAAGGPMLGRLFRVLFALSRATGGRYGHLLFGKVHRRFGGCLRRIATGGSALEPALGRSFQLMGFRVAEGYGMTETSPVLTVNPWEAIRFGSAGKPLPGVEVDVRDPEGEPGAAGSDGHGHGHGDGEIWVRGANVMAGYYRNPEATAEVMADGWLATGDLGRFDADGYLHISGRSKDVIVTAAGKNVYPEEVELRYRGLPGVAELVVLGLPAAAGGERVVALIVPRPGAGEEEVAAIRAAIAARSAEVPSYQQVTGVEIWRGELPKTTTMKVKRSRLRDAVLAGERGEPAAKAPSDQPGAAASGASAPAAAPPPPTAAETWVLATVARLTRSRPDTLRPSDRLADLGVDSLTRVELVGEIEARFDVRLDDRAAAAFDRVEDLLALPILGSAKRADR